MRRHLVHGIPRGENHDVVLPRPAKAPDDDVDDLVAAVAQHHPLYRHTLKGGKRFLERALVRIGIAVQAGIERIFIGIEEQGLIPFVFVARTGVRLQRPDIGAHQVFERETHFFKAFSRIVTARLCASSCSACAIAWMTGPKACKADGVTFWKVIFLTNASTFTPLYARA